MRFFATILPIALTTLLNAQWGLDTELKLTGDSSNLRQVHGVNLPQESTDGVPAQSIQNQALIYNEVSGGTLIDLDLSPSPIAYSNGMMISFVLTSAHDSAVQIRINSLPVTDLLIDGTDPLDSAELQVGAPYHAIYSNGYFNLLKNTSSACPFGFEIVTRDYCIELKPDTAARWYQAAIRCADRGARLCKMGEWMRACKKLNLEPSISDWEWVDSAANHSGDAKAMGLSIDRANPDCEYGRTYAPNSSAAFRCCYSR